MGRLLESFIANQQALAPAGPSRPDDRFFINLPSATKANAAKQQELYPQLAQIGTDPSVLSALTDLDYQRLNRGQMPLSAPRVEGGELIPGETLEVLRAMPTEQDPLGRSFQPEIRKTALTDIPGNIVSNVQTLFRSIPKLPATVYQTIRDLPDAPRLLSQAAAEGDWQAAASVPGVNLIPGVYTLGNIAEGDWGEIIENPLFTALDVAPYATGKFFRAPASMLDDSGRLANRSRYAATFPKTFRKGVEEARQSTGLGGQLARLSGDTTPRVSALDLAKNATGGRYEAAMDAVKFKARASRPGQFYQRAVGQQTRDLMVQTNQLDRLVNDVLNRDSPFWTNPYERDVVFGKMGLDLDKPAIDALASFRAKYSDDFGKEVYGSADNWARRRTELGELVQLDPAAIPDLPPVERQFVDDYRDVTDKLTAPYISNTIDIEKPFLRVDFPLPSGGTTSEILPFAQGRRLVRARANLAAGQELTDVARILKDPANSGATVDTVRASLTNSRVLADPRTPADVQRAVLEGHAHALNALGVDARPVLTDIVRANYTSTNPNLIATLASVTDEFPWPPLTLDDLYDYAKPLRTVSSGRQIRTARTAATDALRVAIESGRPLVARNEFLRLRRLADTDPALRAEIAGSTRLLELNPDQVVASMDVLNRRANFLKKPVFQATNPRVQRQLANTTARLEARTVPARFTPLIGRAVRDRMGQIADGLTETARLNPELAADITMRIKRGEYEQMDRLLEAGGTLPPGVTGETFQKVYNDIVRDMAPTWRDLADRGLSPVYVHHVGIGKAGKVHFPGVNISGRVPPWFNERALDFSPAEGDLALALDHQAITLLTKKAEDQLNDMITRGDEFQGWAPMAKTWAEVTDLYRPVIERHQSHHQKMLWETAAENVIKKTWVKWEPSKYRNFGTGTGAPMYAGGARTRPGASTSAGRANELYIPRNIHDALTSMQNAPKGLAVWDPVMNAFRTSTLLLSPRWQIYNILGNALTVTMNEGVGWMKHLPTAWQAANAVRKGATPGDLPGVGGMPSSLRLSLGQAPVEVVTYNEWGRAGMDQLRSQLDNIKPGLSQSLVNWGKPIGNGLSKITDLSVRFNAMVDDTARIAGYLSAYEKLRAAPSAELRKFIDEEGLFPRGNSWNEAIKIQAEREMRKWAYNWDSLTPFERSTARWIFPFYGFFSHMLRYAYQYTIDHPLRMSLAASFARSELEDWGTALPARLHNLLLVSGQDDKGNRKAVNFGGWNPFADMSTLLTPTGWLSQVNPVISTTAQLFGIDPRTGEASLYPTATYNEQTGRLELKKPNVLQSFVQNTIPQTQLVTNLLGMNPDFSQLAATNPDAANRLLASSVGLPVLVRDLNVPQEIAKAELTRRNAARAALSEALRSGSSGPVRTYPELSGQVAQLQAQIRQNPQEFSEYQPPAEVPGVIDLLKGAGRAFVGAS